jgi:transcriptional regulator GlxA family with amidase domain
MTECDAETLNPSGIDGRPSPICAVVYTISDERPDLANRISTEVTQILDDIRRAVVRNPEEARLSARHLVTLLTSPAGGEQSRRRGGLAPWQKRKIERYVRENLDRVLQRDELGAQVSLSTCHFSRAFKETFGQSPHAYIVRLRLEMAKELMLSTDDALSQIAFACGFADQSHFTKMFRRSVGDTPNNWRRLNLTEAQAQTIKRAA